MSLFGFRTPFPVCVPCPTRLGGGQMKPKSICFDGTTITVRYPANPTKRPGWWDSAVEHRFTYLPELSSIDSILRFAAKSRKLNREQLGRFMSIVKPVRCGNGTSLYVSESLTRQAGGPTRTGGKSAIYLLSPRGRRGTLFVGTSIYQKYKSERFWIGRSREWLWLPELTNEDTRVETFSKRMLENAVVESR